MNLEELIDSIVESNKENIDKYIDQDEKLIELENMILENLNLMDHIANGTADLEEIDMTLREVFTSFSIRLQDRAYKKGIEDGIKIKKMLS